MQHPKIHPKNGCLLRFPKNWIQENSHATWEEGKWCRIQWWDDIGAGRMRICGSWFAPMPSEFIGFSVSNGVVYYKDVHGSIRRIHWIVDRGFSWLLSPRKAMPSTVLRDSLLWHDWQPLMDISWEHPQFALFSVHKQVLERLR